MRVCECLGSAESEHGFDNLQIRQEVVNGHSASLQTQESSLPISMHAGQIFLLTKLLTATDLRFYDFEADAPVARWRSGSPVQLK